MNKRVRKSHRWLSIVFTATVIIALVAVTQENPSSWLFYLPLPPLVLQLVTGLYLFVLPYAAKWSGRTAGVQ